MQLLCRAVEHLGILLSRAARDSHQMLHGAQGRRPLEACQHAFCQEVRVGIADGHNAIRNVCTLPTPKKSKANPGLLAYELGVKQLMTKGEAFQDKQKRRPTRRTDVSKLIDELTQADPIYRVRDPEVREVLQRIAVADAFVRIMQGVKDELSNELV